MKTLTLVRHAHAGPSGGDDLSRPLTEHGRGEAADIARQIATLPDRPQLILASSATRTHETATFIAAALGGAVALKIVPALYLAHAEDIVAAVMPHMSEASHIMLVGHNPGIGQLAFDMGGHLHDAVARGFAPATVASFTCPITDWQDFRTPQARFMWALTPFAAG